MAISLTIAAGSTTCSPQDVTFVEVEHQVNRIPYATVELLNHPLEGGTYKYQDDANLVPGGDASITLDIDNASVVLFKGIIVRVITRESDQGLILSLELRDPAYRMTRGKKYRVFPKDTTDEKAFQTLITELPGSPLPVAKGTIARVGVKHPHLVQYDVSNWDFLCTRADACGLVVTVKDGKVSVTEPLLSGSAPKLSYQTDDVLGFELASEAMDLLEGYTREANDLSKGATTKVTAKAKGGALDPKAFKGKDAAKALGGSSVKEFATTPLTKPELEAYAQGALNRGNVSATRGYVQLNLTKSWKVEPGKPIALADFPGNHNGATFVAGTKYQFDHTGNTLHIQLGMSAATYLEERQWQNYPAHGVIPPVQGLQYAEVKEIKADPNNTLKMLVELAGDSASKGEYWAHLATPYAGEKHTMWFQPEIGDLVVVGFMNSDPRFPVVLGSVHRTKADNPVLWDKENSSKGIVLDKGVGITFEDNKAGEVKITTAEKPADGQTILINKKDGWIRLSHKEKTTVILDDSGIFMETDKDFELKANNITLDGSAITLIGNSIDLK